jgi:hypothetical protein
MTRPFEFRNTSGKARARISRIAALAGIDSKALTTLFSTYLDYDEPDLPWVDDADPAQTPASLRSLAEQAGVFPAPILLTTDEVWSWLQRSRDELAQRNVTNAFIVGLRKPDPAIRSILGSYACWRNVTKDDFDLSGLEHRLPGLAKGSRATTYDLASYTFLRLLRAGSMEHDNPIYAALDFQQFARLPQLQPTAEDKGNLLALFRSIKALSKDAGLTNLQQCIAPYVRGNKFDRRHTLEILGFCGILQPQSQPPVLGACFPLLERPLPPHFFKREWRYPVSWWLGTDGVNDTALDFWFTQGNDDGAA